MNGPMTEVLQPNKVDPWDALTVLSPTAYRYPFLALLKRDKKPIGLETQWPVMDILRGALTGRAEGLDFGEADWKSQGRDKLKAVSQKFAEAWKVTTEAEVTDTHGVPDEVKFQKAQALERMKAKMEARFLSDGDCSRENATDKVNELRGLFRWLEPSAASLNAEYPIGDAYRVDSDCSYSGTLADLKPTTFRDLLVAASLQREQDHAFDLYAGLKLKTHMSGWGEYTPDATETYVPLKRFMTNASDKSYLSQIDFFQFDAARVRAHVHYRLLCDLATGAKSAYSDMSGALLDMDAWRIAFNLELRAVPLPNLGGGQRGGYEAICMLKCRMPAGQVRLMINEAS